MVNVMVWVCVLGFFASGLVAAVVDARTQEIPLTCSAIMSVSAVGYVALNGHPKAAIAAAAVGAGFLIVLSVAWAGGLGGGDILAAIPTGLMFGSFRAGHADIAAGQAALDAVWWLMAAFAAFTLITSLRKQRLAAFGPYLLAGAAALALTGAPTRI